VIIEQHPGPRAIAARDHRQRQIQRAAAIRRIELQRIGKRLSRRSEAPCLKIALP
jgi:hypothetical protein